MNKKILAILSLLLLAGCGKKDSSSIEVSSSSSLSSSVVSSSSEESSSSSDSLPDYSLDVPSVELNKDTGVVSWKPIENADYYNYIINDQNVKTTTGTTIELEDKSNISVQAVGKNSLSEWSYALTYYDTSDVIIEAEKEVYNVYFHDANISTLKVTSGNKVTRPSDPYKDKYVFDNWYKDPFYSSLFDFNEPIIENTVVYAHYTPTSLVDDVYFWVKANDKISSPDQSAVRDSGWRFIPLRVFHFS